MTSFRRDLERGSIGEELVRDTFAALGYELKDTTKEEAYFVEDVDYISADGIKYEVKTDYRFSDTGNLALESNVYIKDSSYYKSWLWTSKADYFIFVNPKDTEQFYSIAAEDLRHIARTENLKMVEKDDGYKIIELLLLPFWKYKSCFEIIETEV